MFVRVTVDPKAKREEIIDEGENRLKISVREPAERNMANRRVRELVANHFKIEQSDVSIIVGHRGRQKIISIKD